MGQRKGMKKESCIARLFFAGCLDGNEANIRKIYHTLCRTSAKGQKLQMGKIKEIFSVIKEEIESSIEERATFAKIEKKVEETKIAENEDYARKKHMQRVYKIQAVFEAVMHMLLVITGGLVGVYITPA